MSPNEALQNALEASQNAFVDAFGALYEHSPWVAARAWDAAKGVKFEGHAALLAAMREAVTRASRAEKLALLRAHPELAIKPAQGDKLTAHSSTEQRGAGLDRCTAEEAADFATLNKAYREKFGFPFIVAVKGLGPAEILSRFRARLENRPEAEFDTALEEVHKIARLRLEAKA